MSKDQDAAEYGGAAPHTGVCKDPARWSLLDRLSFSWMNSIVPAARRGACEVEDLPLPGNQQSDVAYDEFQVSYELEVEAAEAAAARGAKGVKFGQDGRPVPKLLKVLKRAYGRDLMMAGAFKLLWSVFLVMGAYFFTRSILLTIRTLEGKEKTPFNTVWKGWVLTAFFFIDAWLLGIALQRMAFNCLQIGIRARAALSTAIARKCFGMARLTKETAAEAVSFVASDINKIFDGILEIHYLWGAPIEAAAILALLASLVGKFSLPGVGIMLLVVPAQYFFGWRIIVNKTNNFKNTAERYSVIQEVLPAMKLVKYYAWERHFEKEISEARRREMRLMIRNAIIKTTNISMVFGVPTLVTFSVLVPYEVTNEGPNGGVYITAPVAFTMLSLFNVMRFPLIVLPKALRCVSEAINAAGKMEDFLAEESAPKHNTDGRPGVSFKQATFEHHGEDKHFKLRIPEFSVAPGELVAVVGRVGSGKSSLLQAILGNMELVSGDAQAAGDMAYVPQTAWCQNITLRENILFGKPMEISRYNSVLHACALELDLQILPAGDMSRAGLRGINLSGGQRQRLNVARAAYWGGNVVLLDNALSAVDHHTAQHIFEHCVRGLMRDKATVLVTHQVEFLPRCDKVAIMDDGACVYFGPWTTHAQQLLSKYLPASHLLAATGAAEQPRETKPAAKVQTAAKKTKAEEDAIAVAGKTHHSKSLPLKTAMWEFGCEAGWLVFAASLFFFLSAQASRQLADYFIRWWTRDEYKKYSPTCTKECGPWYYVKWYSVLGLAFFIGLMFFRGAMLYVWAMGAAQRLHAKSVHRVLYAPLGFFLTTPVGDLLVSFTKDQDILDEVLPDTLYYTGIYGLILVATTITVSITIPLFSALAGGLYVISAVMLMMYLPAATHLKKLRMNTAGDVVTLVAESLDGLTVIQAYNQQQYFTNLTARRVDDSHRALFAVECLNLWLAFFCDLYGAVLVLSVACFGVGQWTTLGSSNVGLSFSQSIQMLVFYTWSVRLVAESVSHFGSAEKLAWLANHTPQEGGRLAPPPPRRRRTGGGSGNGAAALPAPKSTVGKPLPKPEDCRALEVAEASAKVPDGWPRRGDIIFTDVVMRYAPHLPPALRGVSFSFGSGDKVGVVGRTGSGKSTLLLALYRMFELDGGAITVDGIDISTLPLTQLRRSLSVIPQEPVVFSGTVRSNLDPFSEFGCDCTLWQAVKDCGLEEQVKAIGGLDGKIDGSGAGSWSLGQQQLVCLARAALKKVPILCLDEATAALDPHTEATVLDIIERLFAERTTLTIAHRLDSVIRSDHVLVMSEGEVAEIAPPSTLLANPNSSFSRLVDRTGEASAAALRRMAADFAQERAAGLAPGRRPRPSLDALRRQSIDAAGHHGASRRSSIEHGHY